MTASRIADAATEAFVDALCSAIGATSLAAAELSLSAGAGNTTPDVEPPTSSGVT